VEEYLSTEAACAYLGLKKSSFYNCINRGEISPANPSEKPYVFLKTALDVWKLHRDRKKSVKKRLRTGTRHILSPYKLIPLG
jgi:hypothetical protein